MAKDKKPNGGAGKDKISGSKGKEASLKINIEAEVARRVAKSEKERLEKARQLAADFQRKSILAAALANQDGGPSGSAGTPGNETPALLKNMCGILNKGFASLGADMRDLKSSVTGQFHDMEENLNDFWGGYEYNDEDDVISVGGSGGEPSPPEPFQFRADHDMSDEEDNEAEPSNGAGLLLDLMNIQNTPVDEASGELAEGENLFARFARTLRVPTDVGADLDPHLANLVNQIFERPLPSEDFVRVKDSTLRPANCVQLQVPPVPEAIWVKISGELKGVTRLCKNYTGISSVSPSRF